MEWEGASRAAEESAVQRGSKLGDRDWECHLLTPRVCNNGSYDKRGTLKRHFQPEGEPRERGSSAPRAVILFEV